MANLLLLDPDGGHRAAVDAASELAGHRTYVAGTAAEALRLAAVYVPDAVLVAGDAPDGGSTAFIQALRADQRCLVREAPVITCSKGLASLPGVTVAACRRPGALLDALTRALAGRADCGPGPSGPTS